MSYSKIGLGLLVASGIGMARLHAAFDSNGDGLVTRRELLADPASVDRAGLAHRLGLPVALVNGLFKHHP